MSKSVVFFFRSIAFATLAVVMAGPSSVWAKGHDQGVADGTRIDPSVQPFNVIGRHLFGKGFAASDTEIDDMPVVQMDIGGTKLANPTLINVFGPNCELRFQVRVDKYLEPEIIRDDFYGSPPKLCQKPDRR